MRTEYGILTHLREPTMREATQRDQTSLYYMAIDKKDDSDKGDP